MDREYFAKFDNEKGMDIRFRHYRPEDSDKIISLDLKTDHVNILGGLIAGNKQYFTTYHKKMEKFKDYVILVAEDLSTKENPKIIACVNLGIKDILFSNHAAKAGIVQTLRVDADYRRLGLGHKIMILLEEIAQKKGVQVLYLYAAHANEVAQNLYKKLGYNLSATKQFNMSEVRKYKEEPVVKDKDLKVVKFKEVNADEMKGFCTKAFEKEDLGLNGWDEFFSLPEYETSYIMESEDQTAQAGLSIFNEKKEVVYDFDRFFLPMNYFTNGTLRILLYLLSAIFSIGLYWLLKNELELTMFLSASIAGGINISSILFYIKLARLVKVMRGEKRVRYIGQYYIGDKKYEAMMMSLLVRNTDAAMSKKGFTSSITCGDQNSYLNYFPGQVPLPVVIMHKIIDSKVGSQVEKITLTEKAFCDFRDS